MAEGSSMASAANDTTSKVDLYYSTANQWREELAILRSIVLDCRLTEEFKWAKPCYTYEGSNVVIMLPLKEYCALLFTKGALINDPSNILILPGENTQSARQMRFTSAGQISGMKSTIKRYVQEAIDVEKSGLKVDYKPISEFTVPEELQDKLDQNPEFKTAFEALTPGRQRAYIMHFAAPKQSTTRTSRIEKCTPNILNGQGPNGR